MKEYNEIMDSIMDEMINRSPLYMDKLHTSKIFWRGLLTKLGHKNISNKSLNHMCERLKYISIPQNTIKIALKKDLYLDITFKNNKYFLYINQKTI